jgi:DNA-binding NarL/FixJ family response regulator
VRRTPLDRDQRRLAEPAGTNFSGSIAVYFAAHHRPTSLRDTDLACLTARETEILCLVANGLSNAQLAQRLVLSQSTVKTHVKNVMGKLGLSSRAQGVVAAYESGLVLPGRSG